MRLESNVNLLVAALDLNLVRLVRGAMRAADCQCCEADRLIVPGPVIEPRKRIHPEPAFEPRPHVHPTPVFEPRKVHRPDDLPQASCPPPPDTCRAEPKSPGSPIQPPWKVLPWENPPPEPARPIHRVKVVIGPPDGCGKGNVIDLFI